MYISYTLLLLAVVQAIIIVTQHIYNNPICTYFSKYSKTNLNYKFPLTDRKKSKNTCI